jgi:hypothetical protein
LIEHQWLVDGPASEETARQREAMLSLVEAVQHQEDSARAMQWRLTAKVAQANLLSRAYLERDNLAALRSAVLLQGCRDLIGQS